MGQTPSCIPQFNVPQKKLVSSDYPDSQSMMSPRRPNQTRTLASIHSHSRTLTSYSTKPAEFGTNTTSRLSLKALSIEDNESSTTSARTIVGWLKRVKQPEYMLETPKGEAKLEFKHFCPICYRYFRSIYSTSCCAGNCCHDCAVNFIATRNSSMKFHPNVEMNLPCPNCHASPVAFIALSHEDESRLYVESPRTQALLEASQARKQHEQFHFTEQQQQLYA